MEERRRLAAKPILLLKISIAVTSRNRDMQGYSSPVELTDTLKRRYKGFCRANCSHFPSQTPDEALDAILQGIVQAFKKEVSPRTDEVQFRGILKMRLEASDVGNKEDWVQWLLGKRDDGEFNFTLIYLNLKPLVKSTFVKSMQCDVEAFLNKETGEVPVVHSERCDDEACLEEETGKAEALLLLGTQCEAALYLEEDTG